MRLLGISVRNYRVLRDLTVEFAPGLTLVGAPNESGKSTLIEAAHRGLFLKSKVTGRLRDAMLTQGRSEHPEVGITFLAGGKTWHLSKRFAGQSGQCTLTEEKGGSWRGDEAEARLAEVLGVAPVAGKASAAAVAEQWAHLWVWQGASGQDPSERANEQKGALLSRLERAEGTVAAVLQSALDSRLVAEFQRQHDELFKKNGEPRADSPAGRAGDEWARAREALAAAEARCEALSRSAAASLAARSVLERADADEAAIMPQLGRVESLWVRLSELRAMEERVEVEAERARLHHDSLVETEARLADLARQGEILAKALAPEEQEVETLMLGEEAMRERRAVQESQRAAQAEARASAQRLHELACAEADLMEKRIRVAQIGARLDFVRSLQDEERRVVLQLAGVPAVSAEMIKTLAELEKRKDQAAATLEGVASGVCLLAADRPVLLDGEPLETGVERVLTDPAELTMGEVRLRLSPGGGAGLMEARRRSAEAARALQEKLDSLGLASVAAAVKAHECWRHWDAELKTVRKRMEDAGAQAIESEVAAAREVLMSAQGVVDRLHASLPEKARPAHLPENLESALSRRRLAAQQLEISVSQENAAAAACAQGEAALVKHRAKRDELATALAARRSGLERLRAGREALAAAHGDDARRQAAVIAAAEARETTEARLAAVKAEIAALQPDSLVADRERLRRALDEVGIRRREADTSLAVARSELSRDGGDDPYEQLARAAAREQVARQAAGEARQEADAVCLLHRLFAEEQRELAARLTQPLVEKINGYLQCVFGVGAEAVLSFEDDVFGSLSLARPGLLAGAVPFDALSGGAREQAAAAMRLAMAEVLAAGHDGCLPIVFDDAFAYADPERVQALQRMLDRAARRGLQVIVLTCTPGDYAGLGARTVALPAA